VSTSARGNGASTVPAQVDQFKCNFLDKPPAYWVAGIFRSTTEQLLDKIELAISSVAVPLNSEINDLTRRICSALKEN
jgi:hypothetical protein